MTKPWLVLFEGQDESGKTTLMTEFNKYTDYKHTVVDRAFLSTAVYNTKFRRGNDGIDYLVQLRDISKATNVLVVLCEASPDCIRNRYRCADKKDYIADSEESLMNEIKEDAKLFEHYADLVSHSCKVVRIDTEGAKTYKQCEFLETVIKGYEVTE